MYRNRGPKFLLSQPCILPTRESIIHNNESEKRKRRKKRFFLYSGYVLFYDTRKRTKVGGRVKTGGKGEVVRTERGGESSG